MKKINHRLSRIFNCVCGVASVVGVLMALWGHEKAVIIALSFFCLCLLVLLGVMSYAIMSYLKIGKTADHIRISTDIRYETSDGYHIDYDIYRIIQSKCILLHKIDHGFKWSGTKEAVISSRLQDIETVRRTGEKDAEYDSATLVFRTPLLYNETGVLHFNAQLDDSDEKSNTMVSYKVSSFSELIHFRVILKHKDSTYKKKAVVYKKKICSNFDSDEIEVVTIPFDMQTKSYEFIQERPDIGYLYILRWER